MRGVKDTLPPRLRDRWLLITMRLSMSSFAGTARTLVAVGTWRLADMFWTTRAAAPRSGTSSVSAGAAADGGAELPCAGVGRRVAAVASGRAIGAGAWAGAWAAGCGA